MLCWKMEKFCSKLLIQNLAKTLSKSNQTLIKSWSNPYQILVKFCSDFEMNLNVFLTWFRTKVSWIFQLYIYPETSVVNYKEAKVGEEKIAPKNETITVESWRVRFLSRRRNCQAKPGKDSSKTVLLCFVHPFVYF